MALILLRYNNKTMTEKDSDITDNKRQYSRIPIKKRLLLVKQVLKKGKPLSQIISQLNIKITTARFIINKYKESGTFPRRKFRRNSKNKSRTPKSKKLQQELLPQELLQHEVILRQEQIQEKLQAKTEYNFSAPIYLYWYYYPLEQ